MSSILLQAGDTADHRGAYDAADQEEDGAGAPGRPQNERCS